MTTSQYVYNIKLSFQFYTLLGHHREIHGTLTEVFGHKRIHRLSLLLNKDGDVRTIYCQPCGPLFYSDSAVEDSDAAESSFDVQREGKEIEYSKVKV